MTIFEQLRRDEGMVPTAYRDSTGNLTIGVGHNCATPLSNRAIEVILHDDVADIDAQITQKFPWIASLDDARHGAFINLAFNMGVAGLAGFRRMLRAAEAGRWDEAASHLLDSRYAKQVGDRAQRVARQLRTGEWV